MASDAMGVFGRQLAEVISWCGSRFSTSDPRNSLRTPMLRPSTRPENVFGDGSYDDRAWQEYVHGESPQKTAAAVDVLAQERAKLLRREGMYPNTPVSDLAGGQLLLAAPDYSLYDGASEYESEGFIDSGDAPPWDTWIRYVFDERLTTQFYDAYIVCWVPPQFIPQADVGTRVSFVDAVGWARNVDSMFTRRLRTAGIRG